MEDAISRARGALSGRNVEMHVAPNVPGLRVDPRLISQVLFTLLENAAKYAPPGAPVELGVAPGNANCVRFSVTDSGPGVVPEMRSHVFEKFVSLNGRGGLGLGLAIARGIVESHGGRIWIDSASESNGARVSFEIPAGVAR
jgi:two-component system sensor histidine kinase KdpD